MIRIGTLSAVALVAGLAVATSALAGRYNTVVSVGDAAPEWKELTGVDDKPHSLAEFEAPVVVQVFFSNHCFVADAYEQRLIELSKEYADKGVQFVFVSVSKMEEDSLPHMKERAEERKYAFPYVHDPSQETGRKYGAQVTPQAFVLNKERKIVYMGAVDDNWEMPEKATKTYLRDAIEAALAGKEPATTETRAKGCGIEYE